MPSVKKGESEKDYVSRCVGVVMHEGKVKDASQAAAICHSKYREHVKAETEKWAQKTLLGKAECDECGSMDHKTEDCEMDKKDGDNMH